MKRTILIVDDDKKIAHLIEYRLKNQGQTPHVVYRGQDALEYIKRDEPVLILLDIRLPDISGVEVLKALRKTHPHVQILMISAHGDVKLAVECMKLGAYDFIEKPLAFPELDAKVKHVLDRYRLEEEVSLLRKELGEKYRFKSLVGKSPAMKKIFQCIDTAAKSDANVLIEGESGTGKELVARAIHFNGPRKESPFVAVNCGAIPENLLESELFGHEKGAFTGAMARKIGKFEQARNGTLFLDEIGDLSANLQVKLLRVLQEREIERVGGNELIPISARFIVATHRDLKELEKQGNFREDLYFRINVFPIRIPPLRERRDDIPELLRYFLSKRGGRKRPLKLEAEALKRLMDYDWPGNIRELENCVERLVLMKGESEMVSAEDIDALELGEKQSAIAEGVSGGDPPRWNERDKVMGEAEKALLENALKEAGGNVSKASKLLNISRDTFYRKIRKYTIPR